MPEVLDPTIVDQILSSAKRLADAQIYQSGQEKPFSVQRIDLDLSTAKLETDPYQIPFPFKSVWVADATDGNVLVQFKPAVQESFQSPLPLKINAVFEPETPIKGGFFHWSAQPGKTITLVFFTNAKFTSGSLVSVIQGGVSIVDGTGYSRAKVTLAAATAGIIAAANTSRKVTTIQNKTGASIWVGPSTVTDPTGGFEGIEVAAGQSFQWRNTAVLYGISAAGGYVITLEET